MDKIAQEQTFQNQISNLQKRIAMLEQSKQPVSVFNIYNNVASIRDAGLNTTYSNDTLAKISGTDDLIFTIEQGGFCLVTLSFIAYSSAIAAGDCVGRNNIRIQSTGIELLSFHYDSFINASYKENTVSTARSYSRIVELSAREYTAQIFGGISSNTNLQTTLEQYELSVVYLGRSSL
jgi:hypothetical protein